MSRFRVIPFGCDIIEEVAGMVPAADASYGDVTIVFPGRRPSLYLKERLARQAGGAFFPPECLSFDEFIDKLARRRSPAFEDLDSVDAAWLIFALFNTLPAFAGHPFRTKDFGEFINWGMHIFHFLERLDAEDVANDALVNVERNAVIGYDIPASINELLVKISVLRQEFHAALAGRSLFTRGTKYLAAADEAKNAAGTGAGRVLIAGIYGLTGTEKKIIKSFWDAGRADIVVSGSPLEWPLLNDLASYLKASPEYEDEAETTEPVIHLYSGHDAHSEALEAYRIVREGESARTAIVLPDPDSLFPVLNLVADRIDAPCNISLGHRVDRTALFGLVRDTLDAACERRANGLYPARIYLKVMLHPFVKNMYPGTDLRKLLLYVERVMSGDADPGFPAGRSGVTPGQIEVFVSAEGGDSSFDAGSVDALRNVHKLFFRDLEEAATIHDVATALENILQAVIDATEIRSYALSGPVFDCLFKALDALRWALFARSPLSGDPVKNVRGLHDIVINRLGMDDLPFDTHPVEELEILGMLEARNISFERVIILDVNEGVLPGPRQINPVIPIGVFDALGVPSPEFSEAIYRYNFYRLVGSAREVHLVFRSSDDRPRSRYIEEIVWNEEKKQRAINVIPVQKTILPVNLKRDSLPPVIDKAPPVISAICARGFSPSILDAYVACPLLFYFTRLAGFEEPKDFSTDIDAMSRGDIIHRILFDTFLPFTGMPVTREMELNVLESLEIALQKHFTMEYDSGEYYLFRKMARYKLQSFVRSHLERRDEPFIVKYLEEKIGSPFPAAGIEVTLTGKVDRIDCDTAGENYTVIDYKTGSDRKQYPAGITGKIDFHDIRSIHDRVRSFQLPVYMNIVSAVKKIPIEKISAYLIMLGRNSEEPFFKPKQDNKAELIAAYTEGIRTVITHMLDPNEPFTAFDTRKCMECRARDLCHM